MVGGLSWCQGISRFRPSGYPVAVGNSEVSAADGIIGRDNELDPGNLAAEPQTGVSAKTARHSHLSVRLPGHRVRP